MHSKSSPDFMGAIQHALASRKLNISMAVAAVVIFLGGGIVLFYVTNIGPIAPLVGLMLVGVAAGILFKSYRELIALQKIAKNSVYATSISDQEQRIVRSHQVKRGILFYLKAAMVLIVAAALVLGALFIITKQSAYLVVLGVFSAATLVLVGLASLYLRARFSAAHPVCIVSEFGVLVEREVLPFSAKRGDVKQLFRFSDYYCMKFIKSAVFDIRYESELIFPVGGGLRADLEGTRDEELTNALYLDGVFVSDEVFYESDDYLDSDEAEVEEIDPRDILDGLSGDSNAAETIVMERFKD